MAKNPENCIGCGDTPPATDGNGVVQRKAITIKVKTTILVPVNAQVGAYEAVAQKAVSDAMSVGGALVQSTTSKAKDA